MALTLSNTGPGDGNVPLAHCGALPVNFPPSPLAARANVSIYCCTCAGLWFVRQHD
jgi:hypothetical protein